MLFTIAVILLVLWLLGLVSGYTLGNFIYVLLVIALVLFVVGPGQRTPDGLTRPRAKASGKTYTAGRPSGWPVVNRLAVRQAFVHAKSPKFLTI